jgi:hypothetical protein
LQFDSRHKSADANKYEHLRLVEIVQRHVVAEVGLSTDKIQAAARWRKAIIERIQALRKIDAAWLLSAQLVGQPVACQQTGLWRLPSRLECSSHQP